MKLIQSNISNLTELWQTAGKSFNANQSTKEFNFCYVQHSEWPNKLWFNEYPHQQALMAAMQQLILTPKLSIPFWDIYGHNPLKQLETKGLHLAFEQTGMALKVNQPYANTQSYSLKKITSFEAAQKWSSIFQQAFGYLISPEVIYKSAKAIIYYIAYYKKEAVGTGILYHTNNITGIHSLGILPSERRKGHANQIMKCLINKSIEAGAAYITLQASNMAKELYLYLGFEEQFNIKNYRFTKN